MQQPEWKGAASQRFSGGRQHIKPQGELNYLLLSNSMPQSLGIRTYGEQLSAQKQFRPCLKTYEESYRPSQNEVDPRGVKCFPKAQYPQRIRKEMGHVSGGVENNKQLDLKGLRTFSAANQSKAEHYNVQSKMQAKIKILGLEGRRNGLGVSSLGDKPYNYPEYESSFYKAGGLIAGATGFRTRVGDEPLPDASKLKSIFTKPMWSQKVKMQQTQQQQKVLDSVDDWQQTILKEANPKWNDPDTFFQRMQKKVNVGGKDAKKGKK